MTEAMLIWGLALLGASVLIALIDAFVPSAGLLSLTAIVVAIAGVVCLFRYSTAWGLIGSGLVLFGGPAMFFVMLNLMPHTPLGRRLVLGGDAPDRPGTPEPPALVGAEGVALTDLRPVGTVRIGERRLEARSETTLVRAGTPVRVTAVEGVQLRVRPL